MDCRRLQKWKMENWILTHQGFSIVELKQHRYFVYFSYSASGQHFCCDAADPAHPHHSDSELPNPLVVVDDSHTLQGHQTAAH